MPHGAISSCRSPTGGSATTWLGLLIAAVAPLAIVDEPLIRYRQHTNQRIGEQKRTLYGDYLRIRGRGQAEFEKTAENYEPPETDWPTTPNDSATPISRGHRTEGRTLPGQGPHGQLPRESTPSGHRRVDVAGATAPVRLAGSRWRKIVFLRTPLRTSTTARRRRPFDDRERRRCIRPSRSRSTGR